MSEFFLEIQELRERRKSWSEGDQQFDELMILRLPQKNAKRIHGILEGKKKKCNLYINLDKNQREGKVYIGNEVLPGVVLDLPAIVEPSKTADGVKFYKTGEISKIMICGNLQPKVDDKDLDDEEKKYAYPHGLTPGLRDVRDCGFRKTADEISAARTKLDAEVKLLLSKDDNAIESRYSFISKKHAKQLSKIQAIQKTTINSAVASGITTASTTKPATKTTTKAATKATTKATTKAAPKAIPKATPKAIPKAKPIATPIATPKVVSIATPKVVPEVTPKSTPKAIVTTTITTTAATPAITQPVEVLNSAAKSVLLSDYTDTQLKLINAFGDLVSSSDEEEQTPQIQQTTETVQTPQPESPKIVSKLSPEKKKELGMTLNTLQNEIQQLYREKERKMEAIATIENPTLRNRLQSVVENLKERIKEKENEIEVIEKQLNEK